MYLTYSVSLLTAFARKHALHAHEIARTFALLSCYNMAIRSHAKYSLFNSGR